VKRAARAASALALLGGVLASAACASRPGGQDVTYTLPDREQFIAGGVSTFMERRCGSLDCHGQPGRPLRLYSQQGLRLRQGDGGVRDLSPTTRDEQVENYRAVVGLEPEELSRSVQSNGDYKDFMLFKKPLGIESGGVRHKGGPVLRASLSDPGWGCLESWVRGQTDPKQCAEAADLR
jgi:hypothetical protein